MLLKQYNWLIFFNQLFRTFQSSQLMPLNINFYQRNIFITKFIYPIRPTNLYQKRIRAVINTPIDHYRRPTYIRLISSEWQFRI